MYIASVLKDETDIITSIAARPIGRDVILVIMHAITFKAAAIFFIGVTGHNVYTHRYFPVSESQSLYW
jgi:hypothetical protein